jgi:hypothetical protein
MRIIYFLIGLLLSFSGYTQKVLRGVVTDAGTKEPLPFCSVVLKRTEQGFISNEDGVYNISVPSEKDSLVFSYLGYTTQVIPVSRLFQQANVSLVSSGIGLKEVTVRAGDEYLFMALEKCRKRLKAEKQYQSKVYFQLSTEIKGQPVEMLEAYYNGSVRNGTIEKLLLKNGRIGLSKSKDSGFFLNLNTSRAMTYLDLIKKSTYLPSLLLQYDVAGMKKRFSIELMDESDSVLHISFAPLKHAAAYFSGEIWMHSATFSILKITLTCNDAAVHPFVPLFEGGSIKNVNMHLAENFTEKGNQSLLNHMEFNYSLTYNNGQLPTRLNNGPTEEYTVSASGLMLFYDFEQPFQLPYYTYNNDAGDYRKITSMPYNPNFREINFGLLPTEKQEKSLKYFEEEGVLVNYTNEKSKVKGYYNVFEDNTIIWSGENRIALKENHLDSLLRKSVSEKNRGGTVIADQYQLSVQIFLDINQTGEGIHYYSATVFNTFDSYFNLEADAYTDCFLNICFDLCEMERRSMDSVLTTNSWSILQVDSIYRHSTASMNALTRRYFKEVQTGRNKDALKRWNDYVLQRLQIDNLHRFGLTVE